MHRRTPTERVPREIVYSASAVASKEQLLKVRGGKQSKLQSALARLKQHIGEDEVVIIIRPESLQRDFTGSIYKPVEDHSATKLPKVSVDRDLLKRHLKASPQDQYARRQSTPSDPLTSTTEFLESFNRMRKGTTII